MFSEDGVPRVDGPPPVEGLAPAERVDELAEERTANSKVFQLADGRLQEEVSAAPFHYETTDGEWEDIDTDVVAAERDGFVFSNETNSFSTFFGTDAEQLVVFETDDGSVSLSVPDGEVGEPVVDESRVTYPDALGEGVDLVYEVTAESLKEEIVLHEAPEAEGELDFEFGLEIDGLVPREEPDGSIGYFRPDLDGAAVLVMPAPFMTDSADDPESPYGTTWSPEVSQALVGDSGDLGLVVTADGDWLAEPEREYPVVIDPTVKIAPPPTQSQDTMVLSEQPDENFDSSWRLSVGTTSSGIARSLLRFPLGVVPEGTSIDSAQLEVHYDQQHTSSADDVTIEARRATGPWEETTATWGSTSDLVGELGHNSVMVDDGAPLQHEVNGTWPEATGSDIEHAIGGGYVTNTSGNTGEFYRWYPIVPEEGTYRVEAHVVTGPDRASEAPYTVEYADGPETYTVDQSSADVGGEWVTLGSHHFDAGAASVTVGAVDDGSVVVADTVRLVKDGTQLRAGGDEASQWHSFSVGSIVQDWLDGTEENHGFVLTAADEETLGMGGPRYEGSVYAYGGETEVYPRLVVTYGLPGVEVEPPTTVTSTGAELAWPAYENPCPWCGTTEIVEYQVHRSVWQSFTPSAATMVAPVDEDTLSFTDTTAEPTPADDPDPFGNAYYYMVAVKTADGTVVPGPTQLARLPKAGLVQTIYQAEADTTLSSAQPDANHDEMWGQPWLYVGNNSATYGRTRTVIDFGDLEVPSGAQIIDAEVKLWNREVVGSNAGVWELHGLTEDFDETTATWNAAGSGQDWSSPGGDFDPAVAGSAANFTNDPQRRNFDATELAQQWVEDSDANHGVLLKLEDEASPATRASFLSGEYEDPRLRPSLVLTYLETTPESTYYVPDAPEAVEAGSTTTLDVTLTNTTEATWSRDDWVLSYRWERSDGTPVAADEIHTPLSGDVAVGEALTVEADVESPTPSDDGNLREGHVLSWDLYNTSTGDWLSGYDGSGTQSVSTAGQGPRDTVGALKQSMAVQDSTSDQVGLEQFYGYSGVSTGAGSALMNNLHAGNAVWTYDAFANPSRGLDTFVRLAYNSKDTSDTVAGYGWSLQASSLMRLGSPIDPHPTPHGRAVTLTDGDGTTHTFALDDDGEYISPAGVNLYLQRLVECHPRDEEAQAWVMTSPDRTQFFYDCDGYMTAIVDKNGNQMDLVYEERRSNNKPVKFLRYITDATGRQTLTLDYYARGDDYDYIDADTWEKVADSNLTNPHIIDKVREITDISGRTLSFTYTGHGLLGEMVDGVGSEQPKVFGFAYDMTQGNRNVKLVSVTDPRGNATEVEYHSPPADDPKFNWSTKTITDRNGGTTDFDYTDPDGPQGQEIETVVTDAEGNTSIHHMDGRGRPTEVINAKDETTTVEWDDNNNVVRLEEDNGAVTTWAYDAKTGYPTEIRDAEANAQDYPGTTLTYQTGLNGYIADLIAKQSPEGRTWTFDYTTEGNLASVTDPMGNDPGIEGDFTTRYTYDDRGQLLTARDANGNATTNSEFGPNGYPAVIADALGHETTFTYDIRGQVTEVTDPHGVTLTQAYDTYGRPLENTVPKDQAAGDLITTPAPVYDPNDNITQMTAPNGAVSEAGFDAADQLSFTVAPTDEPGGPERRSTFTYDQVGNLISETEPNGNIANPAGTFTTSYTYDEVYQLTDVVNADGDQLSYTYDNVGNLSRVIDPRKNEAGEGFTMWYWYDRNHQVRAEIDAAGTTVVSTYDRDGLMVQSQDRGGNDTYILHDARGLPVEVQVPHDGEGDDTEYRTTRFDYDEVGNRTKVFTPRAVEAGTTEAFTHETIYDELNRPVEQLTPFDPTDPRYNTPETTTYEYDAVGRLTTLSSPPSEGQTLRNDETFDYFDNGWARGSVGPWGIATTYDYNDLGQQTARTLTSAGGSSSRTMSWDYFPDGKLASRTDDGVPAGLDVVLVDNSDFNNITTEGGWFRSDAVPELHGYDVHVTGAGAGDDTFAWDLYVPLGGDYEVFAYQTGFGNAATDAPYEIDHADGIETVRVDQTANGGEWVSLGSYSFDPGDENLVTVSDDANGIVVADAIKLVRDNTEEAGEDQAKEFTYRYDPNGNLTTITDASPNARVDAYEISYTGLNQVALVEEIAGGETANTTSFTYNPNGAVSVSSHDKQHASYDYDLRDLLVEMTHGATPDDPDPDVTTLTYTNRRERATQVKANGNTVELDYYRDGLVRSQTETKPDGTLVASHELAFDPNGNRVSDHAQVMDADDSGQLLETTYAYDYDPRDRISQVTKTGDAAGSESYVHDANSNVISQTIDEVTTSYNYDRNRLLTADVDGVAASYNYDPFGRLDTVTSVGEVVERNVYDGFDQVVEHHRIGEDGGTAVTEYSYDPLDRTATKTTDAGSDDEETTTFNYLGTSSEVLDEEVAGEVTKSYQYSPWGERLSQVTHSGDGDDEVGYYGYNPHTDVEHLTGEDGDTEATYGYTAYGGDDEDLFTGLDAPEVGDPTDGDPYNVYRYNAKRWDQGSGNYDMGFRNYDPGLNRFLTRDMYNGALDDMGLSTNPFTGNRYAYGAGNPISRVEFDGHHHTDTHVGACHGAHPAETCDNGTPTGSHTSRGGGGGDSGYFDAFLQEDSSFQGYGESTDYGGWPVQPPCLPGTVRPCAYTSYVSSPHWPVSNPLPTCAHVSCIVDVLKGQAEVPVEFYDWQVSRGEEDFKLAAVTNKAGDSRRGRLDGDCSAGAPDSLPGFDFGPACKTHDLGYDLLRYFDTLETGGWQAEIQDARGQIDSLFHADMLSDCRSRGAGISQLCQGLGVGYYNAVRANSLWQDYAVP